MNIKNKCAYVPGFEGYYVITDKGIVYGLEREIELQSGGKRRIKSREIKPKDNGSGYLFVRLSKDNKVVTKYVHRLVAEAFIPNPNRLPYIDHIDGCPGNNCIENLRWVSHQENVQYAYDKGQNGNQGKTHRMAVGIIDNQLGQEFATIKEWCEARGLNYSTGRNILSGQKSSRLDGTLIIRLKTEKNDQVSYS